MIKLTCDMDKNCQADVTHIDIKGYVYCGKHGNERKYTCRCRKLTLTEIRQLNAGQPLARY